MNTRTGSCPGVRSNEEIRVILSGYGPAATQRDENHGRRQLEAGAGHGAPLLSRIRRPQGKLPAAQGRETFGHTLGDEASIVAAAAGRWGSAPGS